MSRLLAPLLCLLMTAAAVVAASPAAHASSPGPALFADGFAGPDGVISNHFVYWQSAARTSTHNAWGVESGSLLRHGNTAWSGRPTCGLPNADSSNPGSHILRAHLQRDLPTQDYRVDMQFRNNGFTSFCPASPLQGWNGVKIFLRRAGYGDFYTAEVSLYDRHVYIQKKRAGAYHLLAKDGGWPARIGRWEHVGGSVRTNSDGSVTIKVIRDGHVVLTTTDRGVGGSPIRAGRTGFRADNTDFNVDDFRVTAIG